ncbi:MAG: hypothetical protein ACU84Q_00460 [Gammaproteobacteria bacterium]
MPEADTALLFNEHVNSFVQILFGFFSITSAFLVASFLAARVVPLLLAYVMVFLYASTAAALIGYAERHMQVALGLRDELKKQGATWHVVVTEPEYVFPLLTNSMVISMCAVLIASVWYFFYARKNKRAQARSNSVLGG